MNTIELKGKIISASLGTKSAAMPTATEPMPMQTEVIVASVQFEDGTVINSLNLPAGSLAFPGAPVTATITVNPT